MIQKYLTLAGIIVGSILVILVAINTFDISLPVTITSTTRTTEFSVVGEGKVEVVPDTAYVDVGILVNDARTVDEAQTKITEVNNKIIEAVKKLGINKEDIKTSNYSINPNYVYEGNTNRISGYNGNASVSIKMKDIAQASQVMQEATTAGANQINGTRFTIDNPDKYREEAREKAIQNAKEQAQQLASRLGIRLGGITNIVEGNTTPLPMAYEARSDVMTMKAGLGGAAAPAPAIEPGSQTISSVVTLYFEKK